MKIIKEGVVPARTQAVYRARCRFCNTEFEFTEVDTEMGIDPMLGDVVVRCPLPACGTRIPLFLGPQYYGSRSVA